MPEPRSVRIGGGHFACVSQCREHRRCSLWLEISADAFVCSLTRRPPDVCTSNDLILAVCILSVINPLLCRLNNPYFNTDQFEPTVSCRQVHIRPHSVPSKRIGVRNNSQWSPFPSPFITRHLRNEHVCSISVTHSSMSNGPLNEIDSV